MLEKWTKTNKLFTYGVTVDILYLQANKARSFWWHVS
jgi:hypothetical protein